MLYNNIFQLYNLRYKKKSVSLHRVFHSIRFKVNKGWAQRSPFFYVHTLKERVMVTGIGLSFWFAENRPDRSQRKAIQSK